MRVAHLLFPERDAAHVPQRGVASFVGRHAVSDVPRDLLLEVVLKLIVELAFDEVAPEERAEAQRHGTKVVGDGLPHEALCRLPR
jgi:hypothetical protein